MRLVFSGEEAEWKLEHAFTCKLDNFFGFSGSCIIGLCARKL